MSSQSILQPRVEELFGLARQEIKRSGYDGLLHDFIYNEVLLTRDAHGLYTQFGFTALEDATKWMERRDRRSYRAEPAPRM